MPTKLSRKTSVTLSDDEVGILDATALRLKLSRSEVMRHLILYQGLCGGDFPLTARILDLPTPKRELITKEIREKAESRNPIKPAAFRAWVKEALGRCDRETMEKSGAVLLKELLEGKG